MAHTFRRLAISGLLVCLSPLGCSDAPSNAPPSSASSDSSGSSDNEAAAGLEPVTVDDIQLSTGALLSAYDETAAELEVSSLRIEQALTIRVKGTSGGSVLVDGVVVPMNGAYSLTLDRLADDRIIHIVHKNAAGTVVDQSLRTLPTDFPAFTVTADNPTPGWIFFTPGTWSALPLTPYIAILDELGRVRYYRRMIATSTDFKWTVLPNGRTRYTYWSDESTESGAGTTVVLDENFDEIERIQLLATDKHAAYPTDAHDVLLLDDNHYVLTATVSRTVNNVPEDLAGDDATPTVGAAIIQEIEDGKVIFEWDSTEHPELYASSSEGNAYATSTSTSAADYIHFNSIDIEPTTGNFIVSLRHQDALLELDRTTGATVWTLGGVNDQFGLDDAQRFSHQHHARVQSDGSILFFDNDNAREATRIIQAKVDSPDLALTSFDAWDTGRYSMAMGSVQKLDATTYFIGWGAHTDDLSDISEIDRSTGKTKFSLTFRDDYYSYRALKWTNHP
ncbi:hypothetical protein AKJ09_11044 [Labilithrix luteola]|uniref:Uncharacterized protein n=1 Tax=Labilithrix luteola TaxID=1391654 RepID=A0A0K1QF33_9BACT|nr:aryl-sulfate sulfotransferase [Labilithrix luteola]AKV04381.1 hypothetical protein AKJ09_11044 [Labilithrix luteola]